MQKPIKLPSDVGCIIVKDLYEASQIAIEQDVQYIIVDSRKISGSILDCTTDFTVQYILWCHLFLGYHQSKLYAKSDRIAKLLSVGREQSELFIDDLDIERKSDYIYNGMSFDAIRKARNNGYIDWKDRGNNVVFIGNLGYNKRFVYLAKIWKDIVAEIPDANLYVIGALDLYGFYSDADKLVYEKSIEYLSVNSKGKDGKREIMKSVHFCGVMGDEKYDIIKKCRVGVPNPSGETETFGFVVAEMQAMGVVVATKKCCGYVDTAFSNSILYDSPLRLKDSIIKQLNRRNNNDIEMFNHMVEHFDFSNIIVEWEQFLLDVDGKIMHKHKEQFHTNYRLKKLKLFLRKLKIIFNCFKRIDPIEILISKIRNRVRRGEYKYLE